MPLKLGKRWIIIGTLGCSAWAIAALMVDESATAESSATPRTVVYNNADRRAKSASSDQVNSAALSTFSSFKQNGLGKASEDIFFSNLISTPPAPPIVISPPPAPPLNMEMVAPPPPMVITPTAPQLPYSYIGFLQEEVGNRVYLSDSTEFYAVQEGDMLGSTYRVQKITPELITLMYLPLNLEQSISTGIDHDTTPE